ncbi:mitochondrial ribosomal protein subunit L2 [Coprinopsis sp. MPI-PUGE-AT-0042]|nr:mitochondrial ribosomal protein subunit L2 [Coprinopsis sp. MPI-PUGE-AT-0042]
MLSVVRRGSTGLLLRTALAPSSIPSTASTSSLRHVVSAPSSSSTSLLSRGYATEIWKNQKVDTELSAALSRRPVRFLTLPLRKKGGRNANGRITVRHRGGGHRQRIRTLDFMRKEGGVHDVVRIEYDPGRSAHIALLKNRDPNASGTKNGEIGEPQMEAVAEESAEASQNLALGILRSMTLKPGNPDGPALLVRSAGTFGQVVAHEENGRYVQVRLQSERSEKGVERESWQAGRARWLGWRPSVRGVAMNACDHPHGGGRGKSKSNKHPVSIWGWGTKGTRTRKPGPKGPKNSNKFVVRERPRGKEKRAN